MKKQLVYLIALLLLQTSCDRVFTMSGHVIDELGNPINNAKIVTSEKETLYSDSLGILCSIFTDQALIVINLKYWSLKRI